jgi:hypothetical protein
MIGPLPTASGGFNRVLVAIDKFTKWIEVKSVTCPKADRVLDFLDELVHRYGLPHRIITDLGSNFNNHQFWEYCENNGIDVRYVSVAHPRANGQVKCANGMVLNALKKRLHDAANAKGGKWIKELPNALWGLRTQSSKPTGQSPYFLVYGSEAILPADVIWQIVISRRRPLQRPRNPRSLNPQRHPVRRSPHAAALGISLESAASTKNQKGEKELEEGRRRMRRGRSRWPLWCVACDAVLEPPCRRS